MNTFYTGFDTKIENNITESQSEIFIRCGSRVERKFRRERAVTTLVLTGLAIGLGLLTSKGAPKPLNVLRKTLSVLVGEATKYTSDQGSHPKHLAEYTKVLLI